MLFLEFYFVDKDDKNSFLIKFGENLRSIRTAKGLTQEQLANELSVETSQISRIERGKISTSVLMLYNISKVLETNISAFYEFE